MLLRKKLRVLHLMQAQDGSVKKDGSEYEGTEAGQEGAVNDGHFQSFSVY